MLAASALPASWATAPSPLVWKGEMRPLQTKVLLAGRKEAATSSTRGFYAKRFPGKPGLLVPGCLKTLLSMATTYCSVGFGVAELGQSKVTVSSERSLATKPQNLRFPHPQKPRLRLLSFFWLYE